MNTVRVLHDTAMSYYDEASIAKAKTGNQSNDKYLDNLYKAYLLEKEAAEKVPYDLESSWTRPLLFRSAASLAFMCNDLKEAKRLVEIGLQLPRIPELVEIQLKNLKKQIQEKNLTYPSNDLSEGLQIKGILVFANGFDSVIVLESEKNKFFSIAVPKEMIDDVVLSYWKKTVIVDTKTENKGVLTLERIRRA